MCLYVCYTVTGDFVWCFQGVWGDLFSPPLILLCYFLSEYYICFGEMQMYPCDLFLSLFPHFSLLDPCLSSDLNSLLPMGDLEDFLSPLPEPSASGSVELELSLGISCEFPKHPLFVVLLLHAGFTNQVSNCTFAVYDNNWPKCFDEFLDSVLIYHVVPAISRHIIAFFVFWLFFFSWRNSPLIVSEISLQLMSVVFFSFI